MTKSNLLLGAALSSFVLCMPAYAQDAAGEDQGLEEIIVTAQKREQSLQDVPVSVAVVSGEKLSEQATPKFEDLNVSIPNFSVSRNAIQDTVAIRGINSDGQAGAEQSVGIYVDGVFRGRGTQSRFSFLDVERVEVLRGPQGTLFGKNTIAGALNITSARPTNDFSAAIAGSYEFEQHEADVTGHLSGPLSDSVRGRLAFTWRDLDKGWIHNLGYNQDMPQSNEWAVRGSIEADLSDSIEVFAKYEHGEFDENGAPYDVKVIGPSLAGAVTLFGIPGVTTGYDGINNINNGNPVIGALPLLTQLDFGSAMMMDGKNDEASFQIDAGLGAGKLTFLYGYSFYDFTRKHDVDFNPLPVLRYDDFERYRQHSAELRYASDSDGPFQYIVGGYFQSAKLKSRAEMTLNYKFISATLPAGHPAKVLLTLSDDPLRVNQLDQDSTTWAVFGQATYDLTDRLGLTAGLRYSHEKKDAVQSLDILNARTGAPAVETSPLTAAQFWYLTPTEAVIHSWNLKRTENQLSPQVQLHFDATDDIMVYASYGKGSKGGGFNSVAYGLNPGNANDTRGSEYEDESANAFEIGSKMTLADGRARLNIAYFNMKFDNLQTTSFTGSTGFVVANAAKAKVQGIEIDGSWKVTPDLTLSANAGWIDFKFRDYKTAGCTAAQIAAYTAANAGTNASHCSAAGINDLSGRTNQDTPEFTFNANLKYEPNSSWLRSIFFDASWSDKYFATADLDPNTIQPSFWKLNAGISVGPESERWQLSLIARNLTNEHTFSFANDMPLFSGTHLVAWQRPRSVTARVKVQF